MDEESGEILVLRDDLRRLAALILYQAERLNSAHLTPAVEPGEDELKSAGAPRASGACRGTPAD